MTTPAPSVTRVSSDMPQGGYPPGTTAATVTAQVALAGPGDTVVDVGLNGVPAAQHTTLHVKSPVQVPVGATLSPLAWPADATGKHPPMADCYAAWEAEFGQDAAAKAYLHSFPTALGQDGQLKGMAANGVAPVVCFGKLNFTDLHADQAAFIATLKFLEQSFPHGWIVFEQEPNTAVHFAAAGPGWSNTAFIALSKARYADVRATLPQDKWPVLFCPSTGGTYQSVTTWYPGKDGCDGIGPDHYCGAKGSAAAMPAYQLAAQICARDGLPAGVGWLEIGITASTVVPAAALVQQMLKDAADFFAARALAQLPCAPVCWWNGPMMQNGQVTAGHNTIFPASFGNPMAPVIVPAWKALIKQLAAV